MWLTLQFILLQYRFINKIYISCDFKTYIIIIKTRFTRIHVHAKCVHFGTFQNYKLYYKHKIIYSCDYGESVFGLLYTVVLEKKWHAILVLYASFLQGRTWNILQQRRPYTIQQQHVTLFQKSTKYQTCIINFCWHFRS